MLKKVAPNKGIESFLLVHKSTLLVETEPLVCVLKRGFRYTKVLHLSCYC